MDEENRSTSEADPGEAAGRSLLASWLILAVMALVVVVGLLLLAFSTLG